MKRYAQFNRLFLALLIISIILMTNASCAPQQKPEEPPKPDYQETKTIMLDIMNSEDFEKRLTKVLKEPEFQAKIMVTDENFKATMLQVTQEDQFKKNLAAAIQDKEVKSAIEKIVADKMKEEKKGEEGKQEGKEEKKGEGKEEGKEKDKEEGKEEKK